MFRVTNLSVEKSVETKIKEQVYSCYRNTFFAENVKSAIFHITNSDDSSILVKISNYEKIENVKIEIWANYLNAKNVFETARKIADEIEKELKKII